MSVTIRNLQIQSWTFTHQAVNDFENYNFTLRRRLLGASRQMSPSARLFALASHATGCNDTHMPYGWYWTQSRAMTRQQCSLTCYGEFTLPQRILPR